MAKTFSDVAIETVKGYWNARPCNIRHSTKPVGSREYFDDVEARKYFVEPHIPRFADFSRWKGKRVLEIGCGIGTDTMSFLRAGATVTAVDLSEESLALARKRAGVFGFEGQVEFVQADAEQLQNSVTPQVYDLIYSFGVIHHTPHPERALDQLAAYSAPGTILKIMMYYTFSWKVFWNVMIYGRGQFWKWQQLVARYSEAQTGCPVTYTYSKTQLADLLKARGFRVITAEVDHIFSYSIPEYVRYEYTKVWYFRWMPTALFRRLERWFGWHLCVTAQRV
jgi:SAM-dependent methyltransferase